MSSPLRIAAWYHFGSGGAKRALEDHIRGLRSQGHHVEVWRPSARAGECLPLDVDVPQHEVPLDSPAPDAGDPFRRKFQALHTAERMDAAASRHAEVCAAQIRQGGFDVLFANTDTWFHSPHIGRSLPLMPRVLYLQEINRPFYEASPRLPWLLPSDRSRRFDLRDFVEIRRIRTMATVECENAAFYDRILVNSRFSRESVVATYGREAQVCYLGIDPGMFENRRLPRERFVLCVSAMSPLKNPALIIESLGRIPKKERPPLVWAFNVGEESFVTQMKELAAGLGVEFEPRRRVPDEELVLLLNRAYAFVYAPRLEPFGLAPLEANACGTPVVTIAEGGVRETIEDGVNGLVSEAEPSALAEGMLTLLRDSGLARRLGEQGERRVRERWSVAAGAERLERHLTEAVAMKGRQS